MTAKYAVIGNPIAHSKSPAIHAVFAKQTNQDISYEAILAPLGGFADTVQQLVAAGYQGVNVTVPFKLDAFHLADRPARNVIDAEAANTLVFDEGGITAHNTDGIGLIADIENNLGFSLHGKSVLLIGAGGAAQGVAHKIAEKHPELFVVTNRSIEKVYSMQKKVTGTKDHPVTSITASTFEGLKAQAFDIVVNATSTGLNHTALPIPDSVFKAGCLAYDMMYGQETLFMAQARENGACVADGLGMLVEQAAEAFYIWRDVRPDTKLVIEKMKVS